MHVSDFDEKSETESAVNNSNTGKRQFVDISVDVGLPARYTRPKTAETPTPPSTTTIASPTTDPTALQPTVPLLSSLSSLTATVTLTTPTTTTAATASATQPTLEERKAKKVKTDTEEEEWLGDPLLSPSMQLLPF